MPGLPVASRAVLSAISTASEPLDASTTRASFQGASPVRRSSSASLVSGGCTSPIPWTRLRDCSATAAVSRGWNGPRARRRMPPSGLGTGCRLRHGRCTRAPAPRNGEPLTDEGDIAGLHLPQTTGECTRAGARRRNDNARQARAKGMSVAQDGYPSFLSAAT